MSAVAADTHAVVWYLVEPSRLSTDAVDAFERASLSGSPIYVSSISLVEVCYLVDKGRLPAAVLDRLLQSLAADSILVLVPLDLAIARAVRQIPRDEVPEMPDRIIAATALHLQVPLVTRDLIIQAAGISTIW